MNEQPNASGEPNPPRIDEPLAPSVETRTSQLLRELITVELAAARQRNQPIDIQDYYARFPDQAGTLSQLLAEVEKSSLHSAETVPAADAANTDTLTFTPVTSSPTEHFDLQTIAGEGGFGTVWRAFDTKLQREVAVKIPRQDRLAKADIAALLLEAQAAAKLRHPNIVSVHQVSEGDDKRPPCIVTDFIDGPNLRIWLQTNQMNPRQVAELIGDIAQAVAHAHGRGITHCDIKPANVLLDSTGKPHLADFGLAKRPTTNNSLAGRRRAGGTPLYMSPEQASGNPDLDYRTDIYSLGVMLYELLSGQKPFEGEDDALYDQIINATPQPLRKIKPTIPEDLEKICLKCLAKSPADRYQTAEALADDLRRWLNGESPRGISISLPKRAIKSIKRHRRLVISATASAMGALGVAFAIWWSTLPPSPGRLIGISTEPPGCEITAVKIDPVTGDPDPTKIQHARGRTPLKMKLVPGDYLIVAVLDENRFEEVLRHVPSENESTAFIYRNLSWRQDKQGLRWDPIEIHEPVSKSKMLYIEGSENWSLESTLAHVNNEKWIIPPFYVDLEEQRAAPRQTRAGKTLPPDTSFFISYSLMERQGKRLPSITELLYLQQQVRSKQQDVEGAINGLFAEPWEWTTTLFTTGNPTDHWIGFGGRLTGAGASSKEARLGGRNSQEDPVRGLLEREKPDNQAVRGYRSVRPRRRPEDFVRPVPK